MESFGKDSKLDQAAGLTPAGARPVRQPQRLGLLIGGPLLLMVLAACNQQRAAPPPQQAIPTSAASAAPSPAPEVGPLPDIPFAQGDRSRGERLFFSVGCIGCHTVKDTGGNVGPNLSAMGMRAPSRAAAQKLERPEQYLAQSVVYPKAYVVEGFNPVMPNWKQMELNEKDLADLVAFLMTLKGE